MKLVCTDNHTYRLYGDNIVVHESLPAGIYTVGCDPMTGFYLERTMKYYDIHETIYGKYQTKIDKIIKSYLHTDRNFGVILVGDKGLGKSFTAKLLCNKMVKYAYPVILVNEYFKGIETFINSIECNCVIFFDEFDKTFAVQSRDDNNPQENLLSVFDGVNNPKYKKMFVITCNDTNDIDDYFINRPGRFHYRINFDYPTDDDIQQYLQDKLNDEYKDLIPQIISLSHLISFNYDSLRALYFDINLGYPLNETVDDLNINNIYEQSYDIIFKVNNQPYTVTHSIDFSNGGELVCADIYGSQNSKFIGTLFFEAKLSDYDKNVKMFVCTNAIFKDTKDKRYTIKAMYKKSALDIYKLSSII